MQVLGWQYYWWWYSTFFAKLQIFGARTHINCAWLSGHFPSHAICKYAYRICLIHYRISLSRRWWTRICQTVSFRYWSCSHQCGGIRLWNILRNQSWKPDYEHEFLYQWLMLVTVCAYENSLLSQALCHSRWNLGRVIHVTKVQLHYVSCSKHGSIATSWRIRI
jgi:hypothetical protein